MSDFKNELFKEICSNLFKNVYDVLVIIQSKQYFQKKIIKEVKFKL